MKTDPITTGLFLVSIEGSILASCFAASCGMGNFPVRTTVENGRTSSEYIDEFYILSVCEIQPSVDVSQRTCLEDTSLLLIGKVEIVGCGASCGLPDVLAVIVPSDEVKIHRSDRPAAEHCNLSRTILRSVLGSEHLWADNIPCAVSNEVHRRHCGLFRVTSNIGADQAQQGYETSDHGPAEIVSNKPAYWFVRRQTDHQKHPKY